INSGSSCGDATHALSYSVTTHLFGCQAITVSAAAGGSNTQLQYNNAAALGGISGWTTNGTTTLTGGASSIFDVSALSTANVLFPSLNATLPLISSATSNFKTDPLYADVEFASGVDPCDKINNVNNTTVNGVKGIDADDRSAISSSAKS